MKRRLFGLFLLVLSACVTLAGTEPKPGFNLFSKEQDIQLGKEAAAQVRQQYEVVSNRELQDYISRLGRRLASQPEAGDFPYSFTVVNEKSINAFSLPGGPTFVHSGLIAVADDEGQLAGVLAHEISHVALRHATHNVSKANVVELPAMVLGGLIGNHSLLAQLGQLGLGLGVNSILLKYSRSSESEADALGTHIMARAGYNPIEMAEFFQKLEQQHASRAPQFLSDHPNPGNRIKAVEAEIKSIGHVPSQASEIGGFRNAKSIVAQLPAPRKSPSRGGVNAPTTTTSNGMKELRTQQFAMSYPGNWQAFGDQNGGTITIAPREGIVQNERGGATVGYGAMISYFSPEDREELSGATDDLIHHLHASNPRMRVSGGRQRITVDGSQGQLTQIENESPFQGSEERDILLTVARPEGLFYVIFIAPDRDLRQVQGTFDQMMRSIRFNR
jgi:hypothetical protein